MRKSIFLIFTGKLCIIFLLFFAACKKEDSQPGNTPVIPSVTTTTLTLITQYTAQAGGNVSSDAGSAITARGVCWGTNSNPTTANSKTTDGIGTGNYTSVLTGLQPNITYYVRAYATNANGTAYGNEQHFVTQALSETTVTDIDGNVYDVVTIGSQTWMKENLKVTRYSNGEPISSGLNDATWKAATTGAFSIYNNDAGNNNVYGKLYNWYAGVDSRKIAPPGWHVPSRQEWETLTNFLGGLSVAGGQIKESGLVHWATPNTGATNSSGFTGLPTGSRLNTGAFDFIGSGGYWWTITEDSAEADAILLKNDVAEAIIVTGSKQNGAAIRCIKD